MACKTCNANKTSIKGTSSNMTLVNAVSTDFTVLTTERSTVTSGNKNYSITTPLVKIKPPMGYSINVLVNGHKHIVEGNTPQSVVQGIIDLYATNGIEVSERTAWLNANIYWLKQLSLKHGYVSVESLMTLTVTQEVADVVLEDPSPADWGGSAWSFLGAYIASVGFISERFFEMLVILEDMLLDKFIGCDECAEHFKEKAQQLATDVWPNEIQPLKAAEWMHKSMNEIRTEQGRTTLTWEQAVAEHRWENL